MEITSPANAITAPTKIKPAFISDSTSMNAEATDRKMPTNAGTLNLRLILLGVRRK